MTSTDTGILSHREGNALYDLLTGPLTRIAEIMGATLAGQDKPSEFRRERVLELAALAGEIWTARNAAVSDLLQPGGFMPDLALPQVQRPAPAAKLPADPCPGEPFARYQVIADGQAWTDSDGADAWPETEAITLGSLLESGGYDVALMPL